MASGRSLQQQLALLPVNDAESARNVIIMKRAKLPLLVTLGLMLLVLLPNLVLCVM